MATNEEILPQIEQNKKDIAMAQQELQNRFQSEQRPQAETITQKAFRMFNDLTKPKQRPVPQYNNQNMTNNVPVDREAENNYFRKLLHKKDVEIRKQRHMITKTNAPKRYIKRDFMDDKKIIKTRSPRVGQRPSTRIPREAWLK